MDVDLTDEQEMLVETTDDFLRTRCPMTRVRELANDGAGFDRDMWRDGANLGWFGLLVPEEQGGAGLGANGVLEAAAVAERLGRQLFPGPFLPVSVVAYAISHFGTPAQQQKLLPGLLDGSTTASWALADGPGRWDAADLAVSAARDGDGWVLHGSKRWVQDAGSANILLVSCRDTSGPLQFVVPVDAPGVSIAPMDGADLGRRFAEVTLDGVHVVAGDRLTGGDPARAGEQIASQLALACVLQAAESVGATGQVLEKSVAYARERIAFGRAIGSFQAIKHMLAKDATWLEACQAATWDAARAFADHRADLARAVHVAGYFVSRHCPHVVEDCMQVHGGIAMTWDDDCHLYLRRVRTNAALFGGERWHADHLCNAIGLVA